MWRRAGREKEGERKPVEKSESEIMCKKGFAASVGTSTRDWKEVIRNLSRIVPRHSYLKKLLAEPDTNPQSPQSFHEWGMVCREDTSVPPALWPRRAMAERTLSEGQSGGPAGVLRGAASGGSDADEELGRGASGLSSPLWPSSAVSERDF